MPWNLGFRQSLILVIRLFENPSCDKGALLLSVSLMSESPGDVRLCKEEIGLWDQLWAAGPGA